MWITDDNTLEDIQGLILCLQSDAKQEKPEYPVAPRFRELVVRIDQKLEQNKNRVRENWFETARDYALNAERAFLHGRTEDSRESLKKCWEYLERGNKAHRRKATFVVSADGQVSASGKVANGPKG